MNHFWALLGMLALAAAPVAGEDRCLHFLSPNVPVDGRDPEIKGDGVVTGYTFL